MKKVISVLLLLSVVFMSACGNGKAPTQADSEIDLTSYPIETNVTLTYFKSLPTNVATLVENYGETELAKEFTKRTGVNIEYLHPTAGSADEKLNLMISSNDLPDIIENNWVSGYAGGSVKAMKDGVIIPLNDYKKYAPALFGVLESNPDLDRAAKTDDGKYYGFPLIMVDKSLAISAGPTVREDWLEELSLPLPETIDDWEVMLTAFKEKKGASAPFSFESWMKTWMFVMFEAPDDLYVKDGKVIYGAVQPEFKNALTIAADWYKKGLLDKNIASIDSKMVGSQILNGATGASILSGGGGIGQYMPSGTAQNPKFSLQGVKYPTLERGKINEWTPVSTPITGEGTAAISKQCKNPALAAKVLDYFYTEEGHILGNFGVEGKTYTMVDGKPTYTDTILKNPNGLTVSQALGLNVKAGSGTAFVMDEGYIRQYYQLPQQKKSLDAWMTGVEQSMQHRMPPTTPTVEETEEYANIMNEVLKYKDQMVIKFITGIEPLEKFDEYVEVMNQYGLSRALEIQQSALERYYQR